MDIKDTLSRLKPKLKPVTNGNTWRRNEKLDFKDSGEAR